MNNNKIYLPTSASFLVTEDCNLRCTYCFENHKENHMTKEVARKGLEYLSDNAIKNGDDFFHAMLFGGEPWLKPDIVEEILRYGLELAGKKNLTFTASMVTNATILTDEVKRIINTYQKDTQLNIQLSVDGVKEVHDKYRVTKGTKKGSFDIIEKNIPQWLELFKDNPQSLSIHGCSNKDTLPRLFDNYLFFREEWGFKRIWFMPIHSEDWKDSDVQVYDEQLNKIADYILNRVRKEGHAQEVWNYAPIDKCFNADIRPEAPCGAGKNFVTITAKGLIYPCHQFYFNDPENTTLVGNIWDGIDEFRRKIFVDYNNTDLSCAKNTPECDCYGCYICIAENWQQNGSILSVIRGPRCAMSFVERKVQLRMREELKNMGLMDKQNVQMTREIGNNPNNSNCLCDSRGVVGGCDIVSNCDGNTNFVKTNDDIKDNCKCGNMSDSNNDVIAMALKLILEKIDDIEKEQALILKKLL